MICCDSCGEWYHGDCVGISVAEGKRMEKTGQEYVCTKCVGKIIILLLVLCTETIYAYRYSVHNYTPVYGPVYGPVYVPVYGPCVWPCVLRLCLDTCTCTYTVY